VGGGVRRGLSPTPTKKKNDATKVPPKKRKFKKEEKCQK